MKISDGVLVSLAVKMYDAQGELLEQTEETAAVPARARGHLSANRGGSGRQGVGAPRHAAARARRRLRRLRCRPRDAGAGGRPRRRRDGRPVASRPAGRRARTGACSQSPTSPRGWRCSTAITRWPAWRCASTSASSTCGWRPCRSWRTPSCHDCRLPAPCPTRRRCTDLSAPRAPAAAARRAARAPRAATARRDRSTAGRSRRASASGSMTTGATVAAANMSSCGRSPRARSSSCTSSVRARRTTPAGTPASCATARP